ncbi:MAG: hypothetical protein HY646_12765 [Acidobacteria bacterium]|nr:hypothetical protein [Acidobacteriota bacterium]
MTPEKRFERIEATLERVGDRMDRMSERMDAFAAGMKEIQAAHLELEAAQKNTEKALARFVDETRKRFDDVGEKLANLTILVDRLIERDLGRTGGET